jgi:hypothetical protein
MVMAVSLVISGRMEEGHEPAEIIVTLACG